MKTAISLPDDLFEAVDGCAKRLHLTRSGLLALAARRFVKEHLPPRNATEDWNEAIARGGQPGDDPAASAMRRRTKAVLRGGR
jgi:predicted transcriptional regulator